jgi:hypothetical protein
VSLVAQRKSIGCVLKDGFISVTRRTKEVLDGIQHEGKNHIATMKCNSTTATRMVRAETARVREAGGMFILMMM